MLLFLLPGLALAQHTDVIRGRVTDDSGRVVAGADVVLTRAYDLQVFDTTTDAAGGYRVVIPNGRQDYLLFVSKPGFKPLQRRVRLALGDSVIHGDAVLARALAQQLQAVRTRAAPNRPPRRDYSMNGGTGSDEMNNGGVTAGLTPDQMGDLSAIAQLMPGMAGGTMFGLPADGNGMLLDGLSFQGGTLPRDADVRTQIASSTYDPSRGGFSGVQVTSTLDGGSVMSQRRAHVTLDAPALQYNDPVAARLGDRFAQTSVSGGASGATAFEHVFYNVSGQFTRRLSNTTDLLDADPSVAYAAGLSPDSAQRLVAIARGAGIPVAPLTFPTDQLTDNAIFLGRFDTPKSMDDP
ncbi:MAG TPA: carboxypeptidase-like regulatory domain-containing protein, partial [Gemmatimonadaceae bacterium]